MKNVSYSLKLLTAAAGFAFMLSSAAYAGCGVPALKQKSAYRVEKNNKSDNIQLVSAESLPSMVGMWSIVFTAAGAPQPTDFGYVIWHGDGTEFMNSGVRSPATQNFCLGVWKQTGSYTYKLNHFALNYDPTGAYLGNVNIKENVTIDPGGDTFAGSFTLDAYNLTGVVVFSQAGALSGARITADE